MRKSISPFSASARLLAWVVGGLTVVIVQGWAAESDPYGVAKPKSVSADSAQIKSPQPVDSSQAKPSAANAGQDSIAKGKPDSATAAVPKDSLAPPVPGVGASAVDTAKTPEAKLADTAKVADKKVKRQRVVREVTVNTLDEMKGRYRSPKKALFMSLVIPGLGQAYVGQTAFNYARAAAYLLIDVSLGAAWYQYVVVKHDRQVKRYRQFADENWSLSKYEDSLSQRFGAASSKSSAEDFQKANGLRSYYCGTIIQQDGSSTSRNLYLGCDAYDTSDAFDPQLGEFRRFYSDANLTAQQIGQQRAAFRDVFEFYEIIGKEQEFIQGWKDVEVRALPDTGIDARSEARNQYVSMRQRAERYSKMQANFIGGIVANHIVSAIDAALAARIHNRNLYETEHAWYDRLRLNSRIAFQDVDLQSWVGATISF